MTLALVVGCADEVWNEVELAFKFAPFDAYYVVKMAGIHWDRGFFHWVTLHPEYMDGYKQKRRELGLPDTYEVVGPLEGEVGTHWQHKLDRRVSYRWNGMTASASSGIYAAKVALEDGHSHIILAGVPMEIGAGHFARQRTWPQRDCFMEGWRLSIPKLQGKVKSLSGITRDALGEPEPGWVAQSRDANGLSGATPTVQAEKGQDHGTQATSGETGGNRGAAAAAV